MVPVGSVPSGQFIDETFRAVGHADESAGKPVNARTSLTLSTVAGIMRSAQRRSRERLAPLRRTDHSGDPISHKEEKEMSESTYCGWQVCESCEQEKPNVEPYRVDSKPDGMMLCDECYEGHMEKNDGMPADAIAATLMDLIDGEYFQELWVGDMPRIRTESYRNAGILTNNAGFVLTTGDHQYQITVVKSR
jgi:hypothetical protein